MVSDCTFHDETPSQADYLRLRIVAGLTPKTAVGAAKGLPNTVCAVVVRHGEAVVGMGRLIGDGGLFYQAVDMAVMPEHQRRGLGKAIMQRLVDYIDAHASAGAYVSLIADGEANKFTVWIQTDCAPVDTRGVSRPRRTLSLARCRFDRNAAFILAGWNGLTAAVAQLRFSSSVPDIALESKQRTLLRLRRRRLDQAFAKT